MHSSTPSKSEKGGTIDTDIAKNGEFKLLVHQLTSSKKDDLLVSRRGYFNEPRNAAIYLIRRLRRDTLKGVGEAFGIN